MAGKIDFGFEIQGGRQIDLDQTDNTLTNELSEVCGAWNSCISCGSCTATCPAGISFREIHYRIRLMQGRTDNYRTDRTDNYLSLRSCFLCGKCLLVCPRGIPTRYLAIQIMQKTKRYAEGIPSL
jgi:ferredoxin